MELDKDKDGKLSEAEFVEGVADLTPPIEEEDAKQLYPQMDRDKSGVLDVIGECYVDRSEFNNRAKASGMTSKELFTKMDEDKNGTLSAEEFTNAGVRMRQSREPLVNVSTWDMDNV